MALVFIIVWIKISNHFPGLFFHMNCQTCETSNFPLNISQTYFISVAFLFLSMENYVAMSKKMFQLLDVKTI